MHAEILVNSDCVAYMHRIQ